MSVEEKEDLENLLKDIALNNEEKIFIFIKEYKNSFFNFIKRFSFSSDETEDVLQKVFIKIWKSARLFDENKSSAKTFIWIIVRNVIYDELRKKKRINLNEFSDENLLLGVDGGQDILEELYNTEDAKFLQEQIKDLNYVEQTVLSLHYGEDMSFKEIAEVLTKNENTVKSISLRAIKKLRNKMHQNTK